MKRLALLLLLGTVFSTTAYASEVPHRINTAQEHYEHAIEFDEQQRWESIGERRITEYCPVCNDPRNSYESSSGKRLREGYVACSWLPNGTVLKIDGKEYIVMDYCGTDAIDIFCDTPNQCLCDRNNYTEVFIKKW